MFRVSLLASIAFLGTLPAAEWQVDLQSRLQPFKARPETQAVTVPTKLDPAKTLIVVCDMWDKHWCEKASERCGEIAKKMDPVLEAARKKGILVVHAPSQCMGFYKDSPARKRMADIPKVEMPKPIDLPDPPCPVDDKDGGCDDDKPVKSYVAWKRQHPALRIDEEKDYISDDGKEIYSLMKQKGIDTLVMMGVHTNMCVLHRTFAIKPMTRLGVRCILVRDLTDAMYSPKSKPFVTHEEGTERIIQFIELNWCPTMQSKEFLR